jgi:hypothetical protein
MNLATPFLAGALSERSAPMAVIEMPRMLTTAELAELLSLTPQSLRLWRHQGRGPRFVRLSGRRGRCLYDPRVVQAWLSEREHASTAEETAKLQAAA